MFAGLERASLAPRDDLRHQAHAHGFHLGALADPLQRGFIFRQLEVRDVGLGVAAVLEQVGTPAQRRARLHGRGVRLRGRSSLAASRMCGHGGVRREIGGATGERASVRGSQGGHVGPRADPASGRTHLK